MNNPGNLFIVSAPSGAGKTSLLKALTSSLTEISTAISTTTRTIRSGETDGVDYHFVSIEKFKTLIEQNEFIEHAEVFGNYYGTSKSRLNELLATGVDLVLEIDWQGAKQVKELIPEATSIFILPPSREALTERLIGRGQDDAQVIEKRMSSAIKEISHYNEFDYLVINDVFEEALVDLKSIVTTNRLNQRRQAAKHQQMIADLL